MDATFRKTQWGLWMLVGAACLHVVEEYLLDWRSWASQLSGLAVTWNGFWLLNAAFVLFAGVCAVVGGRRPGVSMALPALVFINGVFFHIAPTLALGRVSPGVVTSVLFYVPLSAWTTVQAKRTKLLTRAALLQAVALAVAAMAMPFVVWLT